MKKKLFTLSTVILTFIIQLNSAFGQKEYWGMHAWSDPSFGAEKGCIFKTDFSGSNFKLVYLFDSLNGMSPIGRLFQASNGKLYGTTAQGGTFSAPFTTGGTLFEYDEFIDSLRVLINFGTAQYPNGVNPSASFIEPSPGILYGVVQSGNGPGSIYKFDINSQVITFIYAFPNIPYQLGFISNSVLNNLALAVNGNLYGTTINGGVSGCSPTAGSIFKIDTLTNMVSTLYNFSCNPLNGLNPLGDLVEGTHGKLYGRTLFGGVNNAGVLFEYNYLNNTYMVKHDFDTMQGNYYNITLMKAFNDKLYGLTTGGGTDDVGSHFGTLYEYDAVSNIYITKHNFGFQNDGQGGYVLTGPYPSGNLMQSTNGRLYGYNLYCIFEYNTNTDTLVVTSVFPNPGNVSTPINPAAGLKEICRKPSYRYFYIDSFTICATHNFNYTVHSTNANSYQWNKNGTAIAAQTDSVLNFTNMLLSDSGIYTCTMQNQCGQTETMNLLIRVDVCTGINAQLGFVNAITIAPNPTRDYFQLHVIENSAIEIKQVTLKNMLGQTVLLRNGNDYNIDVKTLTQGLYMVEVQTNKGFWVGRVVKE